MDASLILSALNVICEIVIILILLAEYYYDKKIYDKKLTRAIDRKANTVIVEVENGMAVVRHKPKNIAVVINNKSDDPIIEEIISVKEEKSYEKNIQSTNS